MNRFFNKVKNFHLIGIGGTGMNGIAEVLLDMGYRVEGSDLVKTSVITHLENKGAKIYIGHNARNINSDTDVVVYSSAVNQANNPEIEKAKELGIPLVKRAVMLAELTRGRKSVAVSGTHGKTSTTTMIAKILTDAGFDPAVIVGGIIKDINAGAKWGKGEYIVIEADEFDHSFLELSPIYEIITNIEVDHLECYGSYRNIENAFVRFVNKVPFYGKASLCIDEMGVAEILPFIKSPYITYSIHSEKADFYAHNIFFKGNQTRFSVFRRGEYLGDITLSIPGRHNVKNALGALSIALELEIPFRQIENALKNFTNAKRRFEIIFMDKRGIKLIDDYAHHPTEIDATLKAAKTITKGKLIAIFQPHLYSRTLNFADEFGKAFTFADIIVVTDVYPSRETPVEGVTGELIVQKIKHYERDKDVTYFTDFHSIPKMIINKIKEGDTIVSLGAGNINEALYKIRNLLV